MEIACNINGDRRKELVTAIAEITGATAEYQKAPTYAYVIGEYTVDRNGTLTGKRNGELLTALAERGFLTE